MKIIHFMFTAVIAAVFASCDEHMDFPDTAMKIGDIVCTDGAIVRYEDVDSLHKTPIAVVFFVNQSEDPDGTGYAVYLDDIAPCAYSDSLGVKHNTSADPTAYDGNINTHAMYSTGASPAATYVFDMWQYGQSAYIPSVAQMRLLFHAKDAVNPLIEKCGGTPIPDDADQCWYWTSTEVQGQETAKAWLYSLSSGSMQETPKSQPHKVRPIITLNN
jgi:hypothetical protein